MPAIDLRQAFQFVERMLSGVQLRISCIDGEVVWLDGYSSLKRVSELCCSSKVHASAFEEKHASLSGQIPPKLLTFINAVVPDVSHRDCRLRGPAIRLTCRGCR